MKRITSIAEARDHLSELVSAVAHGGARITLTSRGRPKAALIGLEDLAALEELPAPAVDDALIAEAEALRKRILKRRRGQPVGDSSDDLAAIRDGER